GDCVPGGCPAVVTETPALRKFSLFAVANLLTTPRGPESEISFCPPNSLNKQVFNCPKAESSVTAAQYLDIAAQGQACVIASPALGRYESKTETRIIQANILDT